MKPSLSIIFISCTLVISACAHQETPVPTATETNDSSQTYQIGVMVEAISIALTKSHEPQSLETISLYGTDSRYYVMIRGWLVQELAGVQSQLDASQQSQSRSISISESDLETKQKFIEQVVFLQQAIRRIDLE
ncbi:MULTISPECIES: hypothetical protein [Shewanella]|uniref:hypothetical protein n=1 Tax=Shewanella TaxID=22 RepID=UPI001CBA66DA|nr:MULTISPECIES: hypothetical protein [Shewanella]